MPAQGTRPEYWSFVPHPLPPESEADAIASVVGLLSEADQALGELIGLGRLLPNPDLLIRPYLRQEAVASSAIEGTQASFTELVAYEAGGMFGDQSDVVDVLNYANALSLGLSRVEQDGITPNLIRRIHATLMTGARGEQGSTPGEFRTIQNHIGGGREPMDGDFVPPPPPEMQDCLSAFFAYVAGNRSARPPVLVEAAWVHCVFEGIHPFVDGNGRVGRVLIPLLIASRRRFEHPLLFLSPYFRQRRIEYVDRLFAVNATGDWAGWLRFFLEAVVSRARAAIDLSSNVISLGKDWHGRLDAMRATRAAHRLADLVSQHSAINASIAERQLELTGPTIYKAIDQLVQADILQEFTGGSRNRVWAAEEQLKLMEAAS